MSTGLIIPTQELAAKVKDGGNLLFKICEVLPPKHQPRKDAIYHFAFLVFRQNGNIPMKELESFMTDFQGGRYKYWGEVTNNDLYNGWRSHLNHRDRDPIPPELEWTVFNDWAALNLPNIYWSNDIKFITKDQFLSIPNHSIFKTVSEEEVWENLYEFWLDLDSTPDQRRKTNNLFYSTTKMLNECLSQ